ERVAAQVVPVERDVEGPGGDVDVAEAADAVGQPPGERHAAGGDAEQDRVGGALGLLEDLVGDAVEDAADVVGGQDPLASRRPVRASGRRTAGRVSHANLLLRLTGRSVKERFRRGSSYVARHSARSEERR